MVFNAIQLGITASISESLTSLARLYLPLHKHRDHYYVVGISTQKEKDID
jgi:hypothetical protein